MNAATIGKNVFVAHTHIGRQNATKSLKINVLLVAYGQYLVV